MAWIIQLIQMKKIFLFQFLLKLSETLNFLNIYGLKGEICKGLVKLTKNKKINIFKVSDNKKI